MIAGTFEHGDSILRETSHFARVRACASNINFSQICRHQMHPVRQNPLSAVNRFWLTAKTSNPNTMAGQGW